MCGQDEGVGSGEEPRRESVEDGGVCRERVPGQGGDCAGRRNSLQR